MLRISNNKIILFAAVLLCLGAHVIKYAYITTNVQTIENQIGTPNAQSPITDISTVYEQFQQELNNQEQLTWDLVQTNTRISKKKCLEKQKKDYTTYKNYQKENQEYKRSHYPKLKEETVLLIQDVLQNFGLNPADIQIVPYEGTGSPAAADDSTIFIDEKEFAQFCPDACKFFIAHEISHLQTQDDSIYKSLYRLTKKTKNLPKTKKALEAFRRFQEVRADINALLKGGEQYVSGAFEFFHKLQELDGGDNPGITHPKTSDRIKTAQNICSKMGWRVEHRTI